MWHRRVGRNVEKIFDIYIYRTYRTCAVYYVRLLLCSKTPHPCHTPTSPSARANQNQSKKTRQECGMGPQILPYFSRYSDYLWRVNYIYTSHFPYSFTLVLCEVQLIYFCSCRISLLCWLNSWPRIFRERCEDLCEPSYSL